MVTPRNGWRFLGPLSLDCGFGVLSSGLWGISWGSTGLGVQGLSCFRWSGLFRAFGGVLHPLTPKCPTTHNLTPAELNPKPQ